MRIDKQGSRRRHLFAYSETFRPSSFVLFGIRSLELSHALLSITRLPEFRQSIGTVEIGEQTGNPPTLFG
ncbi:hypothetical protein HanXRQr2_Chr15g0696981 [Helianthus annuus]|uniref:Uncharacterized protein n=1 Tax=Helianthus annuus TaxID=4232 RepID=A0A251SRS8_HELAN|nr:hypothetical protein HanXRQr2_Chr15g0696981 [Helianthus annuus]KAJ0456029.1 hypothetical protein HanIR_Chr15g0757741 [Helianthus annuus]